MTRNPDPAINNDLVVVLPGILGSTLRQDHHLVWAPSAGSVLQAVHTFGRSLKRLQLPDDIGDDHPDDGVEPVALMPDLHVLPGIWTPIKGYDRLLNRLRRLGYHDNANTADAPPANLLPLPYDWRLSNRYTGRWIGERITPVLDRWRAQGGRYADAQVVFICHSMGGLVARWYIEKCGGAEITRKLITLGTPYRGAAKALEQLATASPSASGNSHLTSPTSPAAYPRCTSCYPNTPASSRAATCSRPPKPPCPNSPGTRS
jgi:triacylglycerol esterase/lipase EstA (alpha/beta hydrolase family)